MQIPRQDDVIALIRRSDAIALSGRGDHLVDVDSLAAPRAHLFVARERGRDAAACGMGTGQAIMKRWSEKRRVWASR